MRLYNSVGLLPRITARNQDAGITGCFPLRLSVSLAGYKINPTCFLPLLVPILSHHPAPSMLSEGARLWR